MNDRIPALVFGSLLLVVGLSMLYLQRQAWVRTLESGPRPGDLPFLRRRYRRRSQIGGMIVIIGLMIPLGDSLIPWKDAPGTFAVYWMVVLGLAFWTGMLAMGDLVSTQLFMSSELNRLHQQEAQLREAADRLRSRQEKTDL